MSDMRPINTSYCLEQLCESNFDKLLKLIPELFSFRQSAIGVTEVRPALYLEIVERSPYTMTIKLSHCFHHQLQDFIEPAVKIRVYQDVQMVEVLRDHARQDVSKVFKCASKTEEIRDYKWKMNYFLQKWLDHCLLTDYRFSKTETPALA